MNYIFCREIECRSQNRLTSRFIMSFIIHDFVTDEPKLNPCCRMDCIVNASMQWHEAAEHSRIGGIDNSIYFQPCNVTLPDGVSSLVSQLIGVDGALFLIATVVLRPAAQ